MISRVQLLELGFTSDAIKHRIRIGRRHPRLPRCLDELAGRSSTGALDGRSIPACGPCSFLSHFTAAAHWGLLRSTSAVEVSIPKTSDGLSEASSFTAAPALFRRPTSTSRSLPWSTPSIHIASSLTRFQLEAAIREADIRNYIDPERLRQELDETPSRPGVGVLKATLDRRTFRYADLERYYLPCSDRAGLPRPLTQQWINDVRVDFYYPGLELIVETDGLRYHRTPAQQAKPKYVVDTLRQTARRLRMVPRRDDPA